MGDNVATSGRSQVYICQNTACLTGGTSTRSESPSCWKRMNIRWLRTANLFCIYTSLGLAAATYSATLLDLQWMTSVSLDTIALLITLFNLGRFIGSLAASRLFTRSGGELSLTASLAGAAILLAIVPWCPSYATMALTVVAHGVLFACLTVGATVHCFTLWRRAAGPFIQGLHFFFSCGSALAPLIANPFLCATSTVTNLTTASTNHTHLFNDAASFVETGYGDDVTEVTTKSRTAQSFTDDIIGLQGKHFNYMSRDQSRDQLTILNLHSDVERNVSEYFSNQSDSVTADVQCSPDMFRWSYTIVSITQLFICASVLVTIAIQGIPPRRRRKNRNLALLDVKPLVVSSKGKQLPEIIDGTPGDVKPLVKPAEGKQPPEVADCTPEDVNPLVVSSWGKQPPEVTEGTPQTSSLGRPLAAMFAAVYFAHANVESTSAALILPFTVSHLAMGKTAGNYVALTFWAAVACGRVSGIVLSRFIGPSRLLNFNVTLICVSLVVLTSCSRMHHLVVWGCAVGLGLGLSTVFAGLMNLSNKYTDGNVSSHLVSVFMGSSAAGSMVGPAVAGWLFRRVDSASLMYYLLAWAAVEFAVFVGIQVYHTRSRKRGSERCASIWTVNVGGNDA